MWTDPPPVQAAPIDAADLRTFDATTAELPFDAATMRAQVPEVVELIARAERPVVLVGSGVRLAGARTEMLQLVEKLKVPVLVATSLGIDLVPEDNPYYFGRPGPIAPRYANFTLQNCDLLLVIGVRLDMALTAYAHDRLARGARKVMVDIDRAELGKMRTKIDVPVHADARAFLTRLRPQVKPGPERTAWLQRCRDWKRRYPIVLPEHRELSKYISTYYFSEVLSEELTGDDIVASGSSGNAVELFHLVFKAKDGQRVIHTRGLGAMGFGIPAAIGACLAAGRRRTVCLDGDGGFHLNIQELEVVARLKLPIKFFVINNNGYARFISQQLLRRPDVRCGSRAADAGRRRSPSRAVAVARLTARTTCAGESGELLDRPDRWCDVVPPDESAAAHVLSRPDGSMASSRSKTSGRSWIA